MYYYQPSAFNDIQLTSARLVGIILIVFSTDWIWPFNPVQQLYWSLLTNSYLMNLLKCTLQTNIKLASKTEREILCLWSQCYQKVLKYKMSKYRINTNCRKSGRVMLLHCNCFNIQISLTKIYRWNPVVALI